MRTTLVTGGGRGIGRAIALAMAGPDTLVAVAARTSAQVDRTAAEIRQRGGRGLGLTMDVTDERSVAAAMEKLRQETDRLDVVVNNAGVGGGEPVAGSDIANWRRIVDTNVVGTYLVTRDAVPMMGAGGRIVNISSVLGRFGVPGYTAYCASKHGVIGFTRALALELTSQQITVNALCPGWVETEMAVAGCTWAPRRRDRPMMNFGRQPSGACRSAESFSRKKSPSSSGFSRPRLRRRLPGRPTTSAAGKS
jgi:3-hydroxybutyrate dehydrogenase